MSLTFTADGFSGSDVVPQVQQTVPVSVGAVLVLNNPSPISFQPFYMGQPAYAFDGSIRWAGPHDPPGADVTDITVAARIPEINGTGVLLEQSRGADWELLQGPDVVDDHVVVIYRYIGQTIGQGHPNSFQLQFGLGAQGAAAPGVAQLRAQGFAAGSTVFDVATGP